MYHEPGPKISQSAARIAATASAHATGWLGFRRTRWTLPRVTAKLFDLSKQAVDLKRIFAEQPALQKKRIRWASAVAHFAKATNTLIRINANQRTRTRSGFYNDRHAQVGDFQIRGLRICIDVPGIGIEFAAIEQLRCC